MQLQVHEHLDHLIGLYIKVVVLLITGLNIDPVFKIVLDSWLSNHSITSPLLPDAVTKTVTASEISLHALPAVASGE
jgi:hypothetical protein